MPIKMTHHGWSQPIGRVSGPALRHQNWSTGRAHGVAIGFDLIDAWPVVASFAEIIPAHLIDPDGEHRLQFRIDALPDQPSQQQQLVVKNVAVWPK